MGERAILSVGRVGYSRPDHHEDRVAHPLGEAIGPGWEEVSEVAPRWCDGQSNALSRREDDRSDVDVEYLRDD